MGAVRSDPVAVRGRRRGYVFVGLAAVAWSTAGALQRGLAVDTATQIAGRALFAFLALAALVAWTERGGVRRAVAGLGRWDVAFATSLALAAGLFIVALNHTTVARVLVIQALAPVASALLGRVFLGERVRGATWAAMAVATAGVAVMVGVPSGHGLVGDVLAIGMMLSFAAGIVVTRHRRATSMLPAACLSQAMLLVAFAPFAAPGGVGAGDALGLVALGAGQMGVGLACFAVGARLLPAAEIGMIVLLEVVLGPLWVAVLYAERPDAATIVGGAMVLAAVASMARGERAPPPAVGP